MLRRYIPWQLLQRHLHKKMTSGHRHRPMPFFERKCMLDLFSVKQMISLLHAPIALYGEDGGAIQVLEAVEEEVLVEKEKVPGSSRNFPVLKLEENGLAYALLWNEEERYYLGLGKLRIYDFGEEEVKRYPFCPLGELTAVIVILWKMITGQEIRKQEILAGNITEKTSLQEQLTRDIFNRQEEGVRHRPYSQEVREQECISKGDVEGLRECFEEVYSGQEGILASDMVRQYKNVAISVISVSARSAIAGGLHPELAFSMADAFIFQIEEHLTEPVKIEKATRDAQVEYAAQVRELSYQSGENPFINRVKDYVFCHIHEAVLVRDIAEYMGVSANYLSERFHQVTGMTLKQYIIEEKILSSEKLLKYTDYTLQEISNFCAFSSQSRFSEYFQRKNGMTPAKYRRKYRT